MATSATSEATELRRRGRQRLIGAIALVALLVVFVPMLLDSEPRRPREGPTLAIPPKDTAPPMPLPAPVVPAKTAPAAPAPAPVTPVQAGAQSPAPTPAAEPPKSGFAVQVGAFRDEAKLKQAREKLAAAKIAHYTERLDTSGGNLTRLRAGPFANREAAEAALATIRRASLDGKVVPLE